MPVLETVDRDYNYMRHYIKYRNMSKLDTIIGSDIGFLSIKDDDGSNKVYVLKGQFYSREDVLGDFIKLPSFILHTERFKRILSQDINIRGVYRNAYDEWYTLDKSDYLVLHWGQLKNLGVI